MRTLPPGFFLENFFKNERIGAGLGVPGKGSPQVAALKADAPAPIRRRQAERQERRSDGGGPSGGIPEAAVSGTGFEQDLRRLP